MIQPKKPIINLEGYETPLFEEEYDLKIDANENLFGASDKVIETLKSITKEQILKYPVYGNLTDKIAKYNKVPIDYIKVTNGADEALFALINSYLENGNKMITVTPSFSMPKLYARMTGGEVIEIPYKEKWIFPVEEMINAIKTDSKIKIVHLTSPNNPTGECISKEDAEKIIEVSKDKLVIFDETYGSYCNCSMISSTLKYDNIAVVKSFSKDFALAGLRIGYIITHPERIQILKTVISPYSVNTIANILAETALDDLKHLEKIKKEIAKSKSILTEGLQKLGITVYPSEANFILIDAGEKAEYIYNTLIRNSIKVRKFSSSDMKSFIRITAPSCKNAKKILKLIQPKTTFVFDMDGVLVDVSNSYRTTIQKTFEHFSNKKINLKEISDAKNLGGLNNDWDLTDFLLKKEGISVDRKDLIDTFEKIYFNDGKGLILNEKFLFDKKLIKNLSKKYNLAIFTGRPKKEALFTLEKENVKKYFYPIITMDDLPYDKQKPNSLGLKIIQDKVFHTNIYYFGDTKDDIICGKSAQVNAIGVLPPQDKTDELKQQLLQTGAKNIINSINEIKNILES